MRIAMPRSSASTQSVVHRSDPMGVEVTGGDPVELGPHVGGPGRSVGELRPERLAQCDVELGDGLARAPGPRGRSRACSHEERGGA